MKTTTKTKIEEIQGKMSQLAIVEAKEFATTALKEILLEVSQKEEIGSDLVTSQESYNILSMCSGRSVVRLLEHRKRIWSKLNTIYDLEHIIIAKINEINKINE